MAAYTVDCLHYRWEETEDGQVAADAAEELRASLEQERRLRKALEQQVTNRAFSRTSFTH